MKKIKIISHAWDEDYVVDKANAFMQGKIITDIQYQSSRNNSVTSHSVMIVYEE